MAKSVAKPAETISEVSLKASNAVNTSETTESSAPIEHVKDETEISIEKKLIALYTLQQNDSKIDRIKIVRGELPLEVEDLEDEVAGLETRIDNYISEIEVLDKQIADKVLAIKESQGLIKRYEEQQNNVRNNREYDALTKEVEFQNLEIQLAEKRIREFTAQLTMSKEEIENAQHELSDRRNDMEAKRSELTDIVAETELEEKELNNKSEQQQRLIEERLLIAYKRIRKNARNGLAVVPVERDACGGCFSYIPPQRQLDIKLHKKIIVCEFCGRILVDKELADSLN
ncbi:MAG: C4-type zinc ribbon domain-containing protein [Bacteroidales bacterium]|nr:C4-type zinc ribbon domain-containing protein [Bacteroidales bacterium]